MFAHSLSNAAFAAVILPAWGIGKMCESNYNVAMKCYPFLQHGLHDDSVEILPYAVL